MASNIISAFGPDCKPGGERHPNDAISLWTTYFMFTPIVKEYYPMILHKILYRKKQKGKSLHTESIDFCLTSLYNVIESFRPIREVDVLSMQEFTVPIIVQ